ncbi:MULTISPECIES: ABC transporter ATP-binding protein [unclassified Microbacterium]|uniref:ABC transporter ATP-binding protein n=1 Tax=unclassified Microbacterium TaxID=2609290 RepID=UPI00214C7553|nr:MULTISPECIES: ABC transporter ATP-binding protein [unclassified Microbacterium]MCR2808569.1 ABC transporter ATP-binding protein [Microbacterium sp. zg.B185]WIM18993.1 ABC transporter ATP-binding protein [Microbacterium sp. zg-B185]
MADAVSVAADPGADILCADLVRIFKVVAGDGQGVEVQALQGLNLRVDPGELVAVVGASGSGKSTLLSILSSLDRPTAGVAWVAGHDLLTMKEKERVAFRRRSVGFIWQQTARNLLPYLTGAENVAAALAVTGRMRGTARRARVAEVLDLLEVSHCAGRRPAEMSGGEQQRVAIAVGVANSPRVLLADEPTGELDDSTSAHVLEAMRSVNRELGVTTLIVTHDPSVSEHVARTVQIRDGRTSTEVLRSTRVDEHGAEQHVAEEYAVVDRVGRLQLPDEFVTALDLRERVRLALEPDHVGVWPGRRAEAVPDGEEKSPTTRAAAEREESA